MGHTEETSDCSFDALRGAGSVLVKSLRFLDAARDASRWIGLPAQDLLAELGAHPTDRAVSAIALARASDRSEVLSPKGRGAFRVLTARAVDADTVRVTVRCIDAGLLPDLVDAKVARTAEASGLSDREQQVLKMVLVGRGVEDMAKILSIAPRTGSTWPTCSRSWEPTRGWTCCASSSEIDAMFPFGNVPSPHTQRLREKSRGLPPP
jgi:hypothetical protein